MRTYNSLTKRELQRMIDNDENVMKIECFDERECICEYNRFKRYIKRNYLEYMFNVSKSGLTVTVEYIGEPGRNVI